MTLRKTQTDHDHPRVITLPPLIFVAFGLVSGLLQKLMPMHLPEVPALTAVLTLTGIAVVGIAAGQFLRAGTHIEPYKPSLHLVTSGIYRYSRNPIYVGFCSIYLGIASYFGSAWMLLLLIPTVLVVSRGIILPEEVYLEQKFGQAYRDYRQSVRRWL